MVFADVDYSHHGAGTMVSGYRTSDGERSAVKYPAFVTSVLGEYIAIIHLLEKRPDVEEIRCDCDTVVAKLNDPKKYGCPIFRYCRKLIGQRKVVLRKRTSNPAHSYVRAVRKKIDSVPVWSSWESFVERGLKLDERAKPNSGMLSCGGLIKDTDA